MTHQFGRRASGERAIPHIVSAAAAITLPQLALAQASPFESGASGLVTSFLGLATPLAILAVMVLAVVAMTGRISWGWPIGVIIGIGVIFAAPQIVAWIQGLGF
jgi:type IV secretory pathway VirB2 component (pilin)